MRIAVLNWTVRRVGGTETYLSGLVPALQRAGHQAAYWHEVDYPTDREAMHFGDDVPVWSSAALGANEALAALRAWAPHVLYAHGLLDPDLEGRTLDVAPAVFFAHAYYGVCISGSKAFSAPTRVPCSRAFGPACLLQFYPRRCGGLNPVTMGIEYTRQRARLRLLTRYGAILTHSEHMQREYERYPGLAHRIHHSWYAAEPFGQPPPSNRNAPSTGGDVIREPARLLFVGRMDDLKGGDLAIEALPIVRSALNRQVHMTFAGDGPARGRWEAAADAIVTSCSEVRISFRGWQNGNELTGLLDSTDLLVVPSLWPEPYGRVGLEAGRRGVPTAAFAVGGIPEWLTSGVNGALARADPPTAEALAEAIVECLRLPERHAALREGARAVADRLDDLDRHIELLVGILTRVAHGDLVPA
jgi:glycosyltransferase involved in cell wall biosynthesis